MNDQHGRLFGSMLLPLFLTCSLALACTNLATATTDLPVYGSEGGEEFRWVCSPGSYLVGIDGKTGAWVDRIAPICAPWQRNSQTLGRPSIGRSRGDSNGGISLHRTCRKAGVNNLAVQSWTMLFLRSDNRQYLVRYIAAHCVSLTGSDDTSFWDFGPHTLAETRRGPYGQLPPDQTCPAGEVAIGMRIRSGLFIDGLGLICGPTPIKLATNVNPLAVKPEIATKVNPLAVAPVSDDMFVIMKPAANDPVTPGQLVLLVKPPKRGVPPVTVLEFRWLDAPPGQAGSYSIAVETQKLLQNYLVPPQSTPTAVGQWVVRARSAAQPTPGPWSLPVKFNVVSAVQQSAPLPSSAVSIPSSPVQQIAPPPSSAPAQMNRSSSMFTTRGVEGKQAGREAVTPKEPAKAP